MNICLPPASRTLPHVSLHDPYLTLSIPFASGTCMGLKVPSRGMRLPFPSEFQPAEFSLSLESVCCPLLHPSHNFYSINLLIFMQIMQVWVVKNRLKGCKHLIGANFKRHFRFWRALKSFTQKNYVRSTLRTSPITKTKTCGKNLIFVYASQQGFGHPQVAVARNGGYSCSNTSTVQRSS